ncbi:hypothetical protein AB5J62_29875 [Amycolatopsis sp. cg5]|uniref:hypothetical protein n=1 Tax=Amycolatopsis sp. cg5 TaxID=3238802 RepID=UPI003526BF94
MPDLKQIAAQVFGTTVAGDKKITGNFGDAKPEGAKNVSDFVTTQSFSNFSGMAIVIYGVWKIMQHVFDFFRGTWFPAILCAAFLAVSVAASWSNTPGKRITAIFIAILNSILLYGAVIGVPVVVTSIAGN